ncbi:MAG: ATP-binding cassette domain-containing protein, partial [Rhodospirillales bacterium]
AAAGAHLSLSGGLTPGALAASVLLVWTALRAAARITDEAGSAARLWCGLMQAGCLHAIRTERSPARPSLPPRTLAGHVDVSGLSTASAGGIEMPLDDVSLYADPGEVVAVVGDYQSGKSALLRVLAGLEPAAAGHARLDGVETGLFDPMQLRQSVAYVPETPEFLPLTIEDNLRLMNPVASDAEIQAACTLAGVMEDIRVLETGVGGNRRFGLTVDMGLIDHDPQPGFLKRVALARGYLRHSGLLLLDGPERHLDPDGEQSLLRAIEELRGTTTVIVATDRPQIIRLADRVIWLEGGRTRADGSSSAVLEQLYAEGRVGQTLAER